jgi:hypothetical protein
MVHEILLAQLDACIARIDSMIHETRLRILAAERRAILIKCREHEARRAIEASILAGFMAALRDEARMRVAETRVHMRRGG